MELVKDQKSATMREPYASMLTYAIHLHKEEGGWGVKKGAGNIDRCKGERRPTLTRGNGWGPCAASTDPSPSPRAMRP